ncbi:Uncharacterised protein [[Clostridium] sordellii]|uniref:hypothetical protein n=1 Tax=Paraclostridium sordellii TaxID=1505 RepID=UPI0005E4B12C|nr:hypothetical protein [Paeniclostridium sordellii]CEQ26489.1 Uncharacterised protein [[Clostridium] sordellii] [Paeniclostridium sordellii]
MLTDIDKEFDTPIQDENGELIETIEEDDVFVEEDTGLEEQPDSFYEAEGDIVQEGEDEDEFDNIQEVTVEAKENYDNAKEQLVAIFTSILEKGEITAEDNVEIEQVKEQYSEAYNSIKENTENVQKKTLEERVQELADGMTPATAEAVLDILTDNGRKPWLYKDDDNNVLIDGTSIPELTVLVQKLNLIATDGENEGQVQLTPDFINSVVNGTGMDSKIEQSANSILNTVESTYTSKDEFNNLSIGGRNILVGNELTTYAPNNSLESSTTGTDKIVSKWNPTYAGRTFTLKNTANKPLSGVHTFSGFIKVNGQIPATPYFKNISTYYEDVLENYYDPTTGYFRIVQNQDGTSYWIIHATTSRIGGSEDIVEILQAKLEKGNKATDYDQAPEDVQIYISKVEQLANQIKWIVKSGTSESDMTLTDKLFKLISQNIVLVGEHIKITGDTTIEGLVSANETFKILTDGSVEASDITVDNTITATDLVARKLSVPWYAKSLSHSVNVYIDPTFIYPSDKYPDGIDETYFDDETTYQSFSDLMSVVPRHLNGYVLTIHFIRDITETVDLRGLHGGVVDIYMRGYTLNGWFWWEGYGGLLVKLYGNTESDQGTKMGSIKPASGKYFGGFRYCILSKWTKFYVYDIELYKGTATDYPSNGICCADMSECYVRNVVSKNNLNSLLRAHSTSHAYVQSSRGMTVSTVFQAVSGSIVHVRNNKQAGRLNSTARTYTNDNAQIFADGVTWDTVEQTGTGSTDTGSTAITKTVTVKSSDGGTYRTSGNYAGSWASEAIVRQGRWSSALGSNTGFWFFGSNLYKILTNSNYTIKSIKVKVTRQSGGDNGAVTHYLRTHKHSSKPSSPSLLGTSILNKSFSLVTGTSTTISLSSSEISALISNKAYGFGLYTSSTAQSGYSCCSTSLSVTITYTTTE